MNMKCFIVVMNGKAVRLQFSCDMVYEVRDNLERLGYQASSIVETEVPIVRGHEESQLAERLIRLAFGGG